ncbi:UDP-4-amino-4,6-dideoxy-N-acetyl-beta-L-altrosamine transaminase [Ciceribacter lividus]|uniref:UDP-4-amino-4, 6-dideoxy-N-acetyl-beta-L-altrosamine transaminase n=1 Tax=Ciceribacter lividus TaxID=1197950 RepID=A0A6I7HKI3_9HYPH|nr:UDP-4-amino-4,6-dideoxy-N-acetyl-beta-L-altrosamine transaminase [Ciceribacter lividus]RCW22487.1 UDP-4-amino-4,6-dideoxy-N-acetyl-beta-L-altrosamine transaminase [Ciceribacter lividus]
MNSEKRAFLPYGRQFLDESDREAVIAALESDYLTTGPEVERFEADLCRHTGAEHAVACSNGTAALHLAVLALGIGKGDKVIVPSITFLATANAVHLCGGEVIFADVDPDTGIMTPETLEEAAKRAGGGFSAVIPVHLGGQCADMAAVAAIARSCGAAIVEDACHALGSVTSDGAVGACVHSDAVALSFHPVKTITTAEGGAVLTRQSSLAKKLRALRNHGMTRDPTEFLDHDLALAPDGSVNDWYYEQQQLGLNYRLPDLNCALGRSQLAKLDRLVERRRALVAHYDALLRRLSDKVRPVTRLSGQEPGWHLQVVLIDFESVGKDRAQVMRELRARGIGTQVHYIPVHRQPWQRQKCGPANLPGADTYYKRCLSLPLHAGMSEGDVDFVVSELADILEG